MKLKRGTNHNHIAAALLRHHKLVYLPLQQKKAIPLDGRSLRSGILIGRSWYEYKDGDYKVMPLICLQKLIKDILGRKYSRRWAGEILHSMETDATVTLEELRDLKLKGRKASINEAK